MIKIKHKNFDLVFIFRNKGLRFFFSDPLHPCYQDSRVCVSTMRESHPTIATAIAVPVTTRSFAFCSSQIFTEVLSEKRLGDVEGVGQAGLVFFTTQSEIRKVMKIEAKDFLTVRVILAGIEDMGVPHIIDFLGRDDRDFRIQDVQLEEHLIQTLTPVRPIKAPALALILDG
ncbi:MAG: hypothetical protein A3D35_00055 [Candidatus Staskawiczbacteria bacterium RIFCSPHIGHO2_02_FULL_34_9]|uniref:Uncharacterized protein n=1 Tax=Candidatus Staskawiczbacteria bacterium RIFCSPHIGHO2_02_FULL_34_9 TaxID=1802206 RepID=A0A1G2HZG5_9BACT|nr:MAG: hypothetical protein A3D35_00055 [Candidatus Staskawiczbacteria bacterium RIFCSPHIGHO2_02_FULL_34_9]